MKRIKLLILALSAVFFYRCDNLTELNVDPNRATSVDPSTLLTTAQFNFYSTIGGVANNADWGLLMVQQWAQNEYTEDSRYNVDVTTFNGSWSVFYANVLKELSAAKELVDQQDVSDAIKTNRKNIIDVMMVQVFATLTDNFGQIPYTEALNTAITLPKYDTQEVVYKGLLATLENAANTFNTSAPSFTSGDAVFAGNVASWKKLTNSLMLRYAMRIVDADAATADKYIKLANNGLIANNGENAKFSFTTNPDRANPLYRNWSPQISNRDDYCVSTVLVTNLAGDPRLPMFAKPAVGGTIVGMPYGLSDNAATNLKPSTSRPNDQVRQADTPFMIMSYAEVQFLLAEAYQRGNLTGNAQTAYNSGIEASMGQWNVTDATAIANYITANAYNAANWKMSIGTQKWAALYMNGLEAWNEWRRLDYPQLTAPAAAVINTIPVRMPYPLSETQNNSANLAAVTSTPANLTTKVWWDKN